MLINSQLVCASAVTFALGCGYAWAQQSTPPAEPQQQKQLENWQHTELGKMGKEKPGSHAQTPKPEYNGALVNGALTAAGAPTDVDTVPANSRKRTHATTSSLRSPTHSSFCRTNRGERSLKPSPVRPAQPLSMRTSGPSCR